MSQRGNIIQPGVARRALPQEPAPHIFIYLEEVASLGRSHDGFNPFRVGAVQVGRGPRVARSAQPLG